MLGLIDQFVTELVNILKWHIQVKMYLMNLPAGDLAESVSQTFRNLQDRSTSSKHLFGPLNFEKI